MAYAKESEADMTPATSEESVAVPEPSTGGASARHPPYNAMVKRAITSLKVKNGASSKAISSYICNHYIVKKTPCKGAVERSLKRMVRRGLVARNKRNLYKLTGKGRKLRGRRRRKRGRKSSRKAGRRRRRRRGRKAGKKSKKSKKGRRKRKKATKKSRKARRGRKRRRTIKRRTRRVTKRRTRRRGRRARKGGKRRRR